MIGYVEMIRVRSSFIRAVGYDGSSLFVEMDSGETYEHPHVPHELFVDLIHAESPGTVYNQHIRGKYK